MGARGREVLSVAAILGGRFPLAIVQAATGAGQLELLGLLHAEIAASFVAPDEETPDWYAFQHPLIGESLLSLLTPEERGRLARRAAEAVEAVYPGLPGEWCQTAAALRVQAGDQARAGQLFAEAGRRALAQGAANSAVTLLDQVTGVARPVPERAGAGRRVRHAALRAGRGGTGGTGGRVRRRARAARRRTEPERPGASCTPGWPGPPPSRASPPLAWPR